MCSALISFLQICTLLNYFFCVAPNTSFNADLRGYRCSGPLIRRYTSWCHNHQPLSSGYRSQLGSLASFATSLSTAHSLTGPTHGTIVFPPSPASKIFVQGPTSMALRRILYDLCSSHNFFFCSLATLLSAPPADVRRNNRASRPMYNIPVKLRLQALDVPLAARIYLGVGATSQRHASLFFVEQAQVRLLRRPKPSKKVALLRSLRKHQHWSAIG